MITIDYINPKDNITYGFPIKDLDISYNTFKTIQEFNSDSDICKILNSFLNDLDCTREIKGQRVCMTSYPMYYYRCQQYIWYMKHFTNQILYNKYLDKLIERHQNNIYFEYVNPFIPFTNKKKTKEKVPNKFFKTVTKNIFTNEIIYEYENPKTGERITSERDDLLEELNKPKLKKVKQSSRKKEKYIPIKNMTYKFK